MTGWSLVAAQPMAWGAWTFRVAGPDSEKVLEWWPGDRHLTHLGRPFLAAPVGKDTGTAARAAAAALVDRLNEQTEQAA